MRTCTSLRAVKFKLMAEARTCEHSLVYCWKCGSELREDAAFCSKCGASVRGTMGVQSPPGCKLLRDEKPAKTLGAGSQIVFDINEYFVRFELEFIALPVWFPFFIALLSHFHPFGAS